MQAIQRLFIMPRLHTTVLNLTLKYISNGPAFNDINFLCDLHLYD